MKDSYYYPATFFLFVFEATLAILIPDVDIVFNFVSAIAVSCLGFLFPAVFFIWAEIRYGFGKNFALIQQNSFHRKMAYVHLVLGTCIFLLSFTSSIISMINGGGGH